MNTPKTVPSREQRRFLRMINDSLQGRMSPHEALLVKEHTPEVLQRHGLPDLPMLYTQKHMKLALKPKSEDTAHHNQHGLTKGILARIPGALETPAITLQSVSKSGRIICLLPLVDDDGLPILVAIQPNGRGNQKGKMVKSNFITSIYGKDNIDKFIYKAIRNGASVHVNEKELVRLNSLSTHRLRGALLSLLKKIPHQAQDAQVKSSQIRDSQQCPRQRHGRRGR